MIALLLRGVALFTPGGWIASIAVAVGRFIAKFAYWLMADIADMFKDPWRAVVRITCGVIILLLGWHLGADYMRDQRDIWRSAHAQILKDAEIADARNKTLLTTALKAKADAEAAVLVRKVKAMPVGPPAADAKRVRPKRPAKGADSSKGTGLFGLPALSWPTGKD
jgi:hypothetical protein